MSINIVEASISDLQNALQSGSVSSVELVAKYLIRISTYDSRGICLNSIPILNPNVFDEANASDARRAAGKTLGPLDGIPYTLKDSMKYKGMSCASGAPAFDHLIAKDDSFVAQQLRASGCVCMGRTNTPPMMASGMHRGAYGRAESPYSKDYLTAAFSSGSSNGSATATAASFAAFGLGSETVSSGRSPASNNALIAYTPSRTVISPRGCWPLYPTCDVLVPHTRTMEDMLAILPVLTQVDSTTDEDFWRQQTHVTIEPVPRPDYSQIPQTTSIFQNKRIAVPRMFIGEPDPAAKPTHVSPEVISLWHRTKTTLESLGATVTSTAFPLVTNYEDDTTSGHTNNVVGFPPDWNAKERGQLVSYLWDDFLQTNFSHAGLATVDGNNIFPARPPGYLPDKYMEHKNFMNYPHLVTLAAERGGKTIWEIEGMGEALPALEAQRKRDLEDWMGRHGFDFVVFPAVGDVGRADVDTNDESARHALLNGVKYSNGNRAIRHMGVPTVSVCMGFLEGKGMPVNLTFAAGHGRDAELLALAGGFERATGYRVAPPLTPALGSDEIVLEKEGRAYTKPLVLRDTRARKIGERRISVGGIVESGGKVEVEVYVDGQAQPIVSTGSDGEWSAEADFTPFEPPKPLYGGISKVADKIVIIVVARSTVEKSVTGTLVLLDQKAPIEA